MKAKRLDEDQIAALLVRCKQRDQQALAQLYKQLASLLLYTSMKVVHDESLSNEILQDSFIQIWENAGHFDPSRGSPMVWIQAIVRNKAIDKLRAEGRHQKWRFDCADFDLENLACKLDCQPEQVVSREQQSALIRESVQHLPTNQRLSILLAYFRGYSRIELAESTGTNINTIKSWLRRGLDSVKNRNKHLASEYYEQVN